MGEKSLTQAEGDLLRVLLHIRYLKLYLFLHYHPFLADSSGKNTTNKQTHSREIFV